LLLHEEGLRIVLFFPSRPRYKCSKLKCNYWYIPISI
jgi:hypothetical protein